jgi:integrase
MSIYRYKNNWKAEVWIDHRRLGSKSGFSTKAEAKAWHDQKVMDYRIKPIKAVKEKKILFDELLEKYSAIHLSSISPMTRTRYLVDINHRIRPFFKHKVLENITPMSIEAFRSSMMKELSHKSVNNCTNLLFSIFRKGQEWGMLEVNPVRIRALKIASQKFSWWDGKEDVSSFLKSSEVSRYHVAFRLALECGLRLGEIVGLSKNDISFSRCQLHIHRQWIDKLGTYGPTKGRRERIVPFHPNSPLCGFLKQAVEQSTHREAILLTPTGERVSARKLAGYHFRKEVARANVPLIRFHDMRHTFASWYMIEVGDIWSLKGILGHVDVQTTQRYAHLSQKHQKMPVLPWMV